MTRLAVISDTHWPAYSPEQPGAEELWEELGTGYDQIWHAGDVVHDSVLEALEKFAPVFCVKGNCDGFFARSLPHTVVETVEQIKIAMTHGWDLPLDHAPTVVNRFAKDVDLIIHGHTHKKRLQRYSRPNESEVTLLNPGSISSPRGGEQPGFTEVTIDGNKLECRHIYF